MNNLRLNDFVVETVKKTTTKKRHKRELLVELTKTDEMFNKTDTRCHIESTCDMTAYSAKLLRPSPETPIKKLKSKSHGSEATLKKKH